MVEGAAREAARLGTTPENPVLPNTGTTPPVNTTPPTTQPTLPLTPLAIPFHPLPLNPVNPTIDPTLANPTTDEEKDIFHDSIQGKEEENQDYILDLNSQDDNSKSKPVSGVRELQNDPPEDDASSAKMSRKNNTTAPFK
jgi:hypothetical protein